MSDFDDEPRGRSATGAVVIAVIFLAILGTGVGIVLGTQHKDDERDNAANESTPSATATAAPSVTSTGTGKPSNTKPPTNNGTYRPTTRDKCPDQTVEAVGASLTVKRYIKTNRSEVWICSGGGRTYYQGHTLSGPFNGATTNSTIFLSTVSLNGDVFVATNNDTRYLVGKNSLQIEENGNVTNDEPVSDLYEG